MRFFRLLILLPAALASGCASVGYLAQATGGQLEIMARTRPIPELLNGPATAEPESGVATEPLSPALRARLEHILEIREYATRSLALPDNGSYRNYAALDRPYVAWNVIATPEFSLTPRRWCFPIAGCVPYRGYFSRDRAERFARSLRREGLDVRVAPVTAYSTLGWFRDPVLSSQLRHNDTDLAAVIFHELAHQLVYVPDDAVFNESFATTVEIEGLRRWLTQGGNDAALADARRARERQQEFVALLLAHRTRLASLYATAASADDMRRTKAEIFSDLRSAYAAQRARWEGYAGYDSWFTPDLNNAHLASVELYHQHVPGFQALLQEARGDLPAFYQAVRELARLPADQRRARLNALRSGAQARAE